MKELKPEALWTDSSIDWPGLEEVSVCIRTYGDIYAAVSGNKSFKLKYFLKEARPGQTLISFGGAWSNHLLALAAEAKARQNPCVGVIRGEEPENYSPSLLKMKEFGMQLLFVSRNNYRNKEEAIFLDQLRTRFPDALIIPEGGAGASGIKGAQEMVNENEPFDFVVLPTATGTTLAGIALKLRNSHTQVIGIQVLKGNSVIRNELLRTASLDVHDFEHVRIFEEFHHGGYAKTSPELEQFANKWNATALPALDKVYGVKAMYALIKLAESGSFKPGSRMLYVHTGGLF